MGYTEMDLVRDHSKTTRQARHLLAWIARYINTDNGKHSGKTYVGRDPLMKSVGLRWKKDFYRLQKILVDSGELVIERGAGPGGADLRSLALIAPTPAKVDLTGALDDCDHTPPHTNEDDCPTYAKDFVWVWDDVDGEQRQPGPRNTGPEINDADKETLAGRPTEAQTAATRAQAKQARKREKRRRNRELASDHMSSEDGG